ncbi:MAG TPA: AraC family transcriptional regulator [Puia sp.]|nr:AraC family transcriptional regulator [Puia sp.]
MNTPLLSNGVGELSYSDTIPPSLLAYLIKEAVPQATSGAFGDFLFQEIATPEAVVWYNNYRLLQPRHFINLGRLPKIELQFSLNNSFSYHGEGLGRRELRDGSFNLLYMPKVNSEIVFLPGRVYTTFDIYLTPLLMRKLLHFYPILGVFLEKIGRREVAMLCPVNQLTTTPMSKIIDDILDNPFKEGGHGFYVATKVSELLLTVLERITSHPVLKQVYFREEEIQLIYEAKDELLKNLDQPMTLQLLSRKVGLNRHKLKIGFQEFYGTTVTVYRLHARMKEAKLQLLTTDLSIEDIGYNTAYTNAQHFSKAYKKYYGHTPARVRKDRDNESRGDEEKGVDAA